MVLLLLAIGAVVVSVLVGMLGSRSIKRGDVATAGTVAGTPIAIQRNADGSPAIESIPGLDQLPSEDLSQNNSVSVQLLMIAFPSLCSNCMTPTRYLVHVYDLGSFFVKQNPSVGGQKGNQLDKDRAATMQRMSPASKRGRPAAAASGQMICLISGLTAFFPDLQARRL